MDGGVEQQRDVRLVDHPFQNDRVEHEGIALGVAIQVFDE
jgi:hypothetical protein